VGWAGHAERMGSQSTIGGSAMIDQRTGSLGSADDAAGLAVTSGKESAGILLYRLGGDGDLEVLVVHPGGPLWRGKEAGAWSIPKGELGADEDARMAAIREFAEETGAALSPGTMLVSLGSVTLRSGKVVRAWSARGDVEVTGLRSDTFEMEWPPRSGVTASFPEVDRYAWVGPEEARRLLNPALGELVTRLESFLACLSPLDHYQ